MNWESMGKSDDQEPFWYALDVSIDPAALEAVQFGLMEAGSVGTEATDAKVTAYFEKLPNRELIRAELASALAIYSQPSSAVRELDLRLEPNRDWLVEWKKDWQPVAVGERFLIAPPWAETSEENQRIVIRIEPGMAFGTGTHETTQLCLRAIENHFRGQSFMDVGTGTGILAIAAAKLAPSAQVDAYDNDATAIVIAKENARLNRVEQINYHVGSIDGIVSSAHCVCANLTEETILLLLRDLLDATCGRLILSGILITQVDSVVAALQKLGISAQPQLDQMGEWACVVV